jgi:tetratricopeptide (TPR) repeat protein
MARLEGRTLLALLPSVQVEGAATWLQALSDELGAAAFAAGIAFYPTDLLAEADAGGSSGPSAEDIIARAEFALKSALARGAGVYLTFEEASEIIPGAPRRSRFIGEAEPLLAESENFAVLMARVEELRDELAGLDQERIEERLAAYGSLAEKLLPGSKVVAPWSWDTLGVLLEGADEAGAKESAALLKRGAEEELGSTLTLGIAVYPFRGFAAGDVPLNAARALTHAGFFGPGAIQAFDAVSLNIAGDRLLAVGDEAGAIELFDLALELNPGEINVLNSLGVLFGRRGEFEKARSFFEKAAQAAPEDFMAAYNLGSVNLALGEREGALKSFIDAARIDPGRGEPLLMAGRLLVEDGRYGEGKDFLKRAWDTGLREHLLDRFLGEALVAAGDEAEGRLHLMRALRDHPDDPGGLKVLARSYIEDEREADLAVSLLERARELAPEDPEIKELIDKARNLGDDTATGPSEREG